MTHRSRAQTAPYFTPSSLFTLMISGWLAVLSACGPVETKTADPTVAPQLLVRSDYQKGEVTQLCNDAIAQIKAKLDEIAAIPSGSRTIDNTLLAFESATADFSDATLPLTFMEYVSVNSEVQKEGAECEDVVGKSSVDISTRKDLYLAIKGQAPRNDDEKRLLSETLKNFESNGLNLDEKELAQMKDLMKRLSSAESKFSSNLNNDTSTVELTQDELLGLPASYVEGLKKNEGGSKFIVPTRESDYEVVLGNASSGVARRKWLFAYLNRQGVENTQLLEEAIALRQQIAHLMRYTNWADYRIRDRMAKDSKTVLGFLDSLKDKLAQRSQQDLAKLFEFKKELDPNATEVNEWDINYLAYQLKKRDFSLDPEKIKEYFPVSLVISGMFQVYSELLNVHINEVQNPQVWSPDVKLYRIEDARDGQLIGFFYTDFFPRSHKYEHAASFSLISGRILPGGVYSHPVSAIVANLASPPAGKPSLLSHDDVVTIFHEFGHIMHQTLTRAPYVSLSGANVAQDFVEAPSQMLENWPWNATILSKLSGHYLNPQEKLPDELLQRMVDARDFNQGYNYTRQLTLALLDMTYHTADGPVDTAAVYGHLYKELIGVTPMEGEHFPASFGHLMGGYDAGYYGYLWSEVYAADMFTRFSSVGLLSPKIGMEYRQTILENGNMKDAMDLLREFLGREPNQEAFFKKLHI